MHTAMPRNERGLHSGVSNPQILAARAGHLGFCGRDSALLLRHPQNGAVNAMSRPFWLRPLPLAERPEDSVAKAAALGEPLEALLRTGAACLLEAVNADRAGVWAEEVAGEPLWRGQLAQVESIGPISASCNVNSYEAFPVEFNDMNAPLEFFAPVFPVGPRDFFEGISTAVGMPLKVGDCILGALLACSRRPGKLAGREVLENIAAEIAVSVYSNRSRAQLERTHQALHLREEIALATSRKAAGEFRATAGNGN